MTTGETTLYAAVGIPQGLITDPKAAETAGAVRRGGELVSLPLDDYELWTCLGTPMSLAALDAAAAARGWRAAHGRIQRLTELNLLLELDTEGNLDGQLGYLRPIPRGPARATSPPNPASTRSRARPHRSHPPSPWTRWGSCCGGNSMAPSH